MHYAIDRYLLDELATVWSGSTTFRDVAEALRCVEFSIGARFTLFGGTGNSNGIVEALLNKKYDIIIYGNVIYMVSKTLFWQCGRENWNIFLTNYFHHTWPRNIRCIHIVVMNDIRRLSEIWCRTLRIRPLDHLSLALWNFLSFAFVYMFIKNARICSFISVVSILSPFVFM